MNIELLDETKCPWCGSPLEENWHSWDERKQREHKTEACCRDCNIHFEYDLETHVIVKQINKLNAVVRYYTDDLYHADLETLIPGIEGIMALYYLPDGSGWRRTPEEQKAREEIRRNTRETSGVKYLHSQRRNNND